MQTVDGDKVVFTNTKNLFELFPMCVLPFKLTNNKI